MKPQFTPGQSVNVKVSADVTKYGSVQRVAENVVYVKHFNGSVVGYKPELVTENVIAEKQQRPYGVGLKDEFAAIQAIMEKKLTPAEMKKREEVAKAIERENPDMPMDKKMAIATATAKKVAEETVEEAYPGYKEKGKELDAATKKIQASLDNRTRGRELDAATKKIQASLDKRMKKEEVEQTEDVHYCAKHVFSERFGEGVVVEGSHAEPNEQGLIEWYDVDFGGTVRRVMTEKVKVMHAEYHMNHKRKMKEEDEMDDDDEDEKNEKEMKEAKSHTVPKTAKEKDLAALAHPKDKITHADVMVGRGVKKEGVMDTLKKVGGKVLDTLGHGDDEQMRKDLQKKMGIPQTGKPGMAKQNEEVELDEAYKDPDQHYAKQTQPMKDAINMHLRKGKSYWDAVRASKVHVKERVEADLAEAMISYSDFQAKLDAHKKAGNKIKDDKYDKNKASYTVIDQDGVGKKITHTPSGTKQDHLGQVEKVKDAETQTTEKRGRGRPAGSKSGARN